MSAKKHITSILLLLTLLSPVIVTYSWMHARKTVIRKQVKRKIIAGLDTSELVLLTFTQSDLDTKLRWVHSKEFEYNTQMYDIVTHIEHGDSISFYCWWDKDETELNKQLVTLAHIAFGNDPVKQQKESKLLNFYRSLYVFRSFDFHFHCANQSKYESSTNQSIYHQEYKAPPTPPPKIMV